MPGFREQRAILDGWRGHGSRERVAGNRAALTFDDGPDPDATPLVLEVLAESAEPTALALWAIADGAAGRGIELGTL